MGFNQVIFRRSFSLKLLELCHLSLGQLLFRRLLKTVAPGARLAFFPGFQYNFAYARHSIRSPWTSR